MTHKDILGSKGRTYSVCGIIFVFTVFFYTMFFQFGTATVAALTTISDTMSTLEASTVANHDIKFRTPTGMSSGNLVIDFNTAGFTSGTADYTDIDLQYGSSSAEVGGACSSNCTKATLAGSAGADAWGAVFLSNDLTLSYPSSGGTAIAGNDYVRIMIGTNATTGATGDQRLTNPGTTGTKTITLNVGTGPVDTGKLAVVILTDNTQVIGTTVDPYLTFTMDENVITLTKSGGGNPTYLATGYNNGTANTLTAATNATSGYTLSYYGDTLSGNGNSIDAMAVKAASSTGSEQFGFNLKDNATPNTGAEPAGGSGAPASDYATADQYKYIVNTTTTMASASAATATTTFTASYIANITETTEAGAYSTIVTYVCTGNF